MSAVWFWLELIEAPIWTHSICPKPRKQNSSNILNCFGSWLGWKSKLAQISLSFSMRKILSLNLNQLENVLLHSATVNYPFFFFFRNFIDFWWENCSAQKFPENEFQTYFIQFYVVNFVGFKKFNSVDTNTTWHYVLMSYFVKFISVLSAPNYLSTARQKKIIIHIEGRFFCSLELMNASDDFPVGTY